MTTEEKQPRGEVDIDRLTERVDEVNRAAKALLQKVRDGAPVPKPALRLVPPPGAQSGVQAS
jgi:hypothetical protein